MEIKTCNEKQNPKHTPHFGEGWYERYRRQITISDIGILGQKKLAASSALIVGAGGLGSPVAYYLTAAGIGKIGIIDSDNVDLSNLNRQILHFSYDVGRSKAVSAMETINALNPECEVNAYQERLTAENIIKIINDYDIVVDCTDNFDTRYLINDACIIAKKPLFYGAVLKMFGQAMTIIPNESACYRCLFRIPPPTSATPNLELEGVIGVLPGVIGIIQATEVIKYVLGNQQLLTNRMLTYNVKTLKFDEIVVNKNINCPVCGKNPIANAFLNRDSSSC